MSDLRERVAREVADELGNISNACQLETEEQRMAWGYGIADRAIALFDEERRALEERVSTQNKVWHEALVRAEKAEARVKELQEELLGAIRKIEVEVAICRAALGKEEA